LNIKKHIIKFFAIFILVIFTFGCTKKTLVSVDATVTVTKAVDSLPCQVYVEYYDVTNGTINQTVSSNWTIQRSLHSDQYATLKATAMSNIKTISIQLTGNGTTVSNNCNSSNCTIDIRKNMYE
jgi:dihydroneopterin aldolase